MATMYSGSSVPSSSLYSGGSLYAARPDFGGSLWNKVMGVGAGATAATVAPDFGGSLWNRVMSGAQPPSVTVTPITKPTSDFGGQLINNAQQAVTNLLQSKSPGGASAATAPTQTPAKNTATMSQQSAKPDPTMAGASPTKYGPPKSDPSKIVQQSLSQAGVNKSPEYLPGKYDVLTEKSQKQFGALLGNRQQVLNQDAAQNQVIQNQELSKYGRAAAIDTSQYAQKTGIDTGAVAARMRTSNYYDRLDKQWDQHNAFAKEARDQAEANTNRAEAARQFNVSAALQKRAIDAPLNAQSAAQSAANLGQGYMQGRQIASDEKIAAMNANAALRAGFQQSVDARLPQLFSGVLLAR